MRAFPSRLVAVLLVAMVGLCACSFDARFGGARVSCTGDSDCPDPATFCAQTDPSDPARFCIARDSVGMVAISGVTVHREDGATASRFSRQSGFDRGRLEVTLEGTAQSVTAFVAGALVTCPPPSTGDQTWQCAFSVGPDTSEGSELARVTATDVLGRSASERAPLTFDFTAPSVVAATVTTRIAPPSQSPLALLGPQWAPTALSTGSSLQVTFGLDEATATPGRVWLEPGVDLPPAQRIGTVWRGELVLPSGLADGTLALQATVTDDVGNVSTPQPLAVFAKDDAPPAAPVVANAASRVERRPFAVSRPGVFLTLDRAVEPDSVVLASLPTSNFAVGIVRADATGSAPAEQLAVADVAGLSLTAVDAAGNASPTVAVRRFVLHATPGPGTIPNPSVLERRPQLVPSLIVTRALSANGPAMQSDDGVFSTVSALATWRKEFFDPLNFTCGAAVSDTARGSMVVAGAWQAPCADTNASVVFFNGAGARRTNPPFVTSQRGVPVYDTQRSQVMVLPFAGGGGPAVFDTNFVGRVGGFPSGATASAGAYDPRRDGVMGITPQGVVYVFDRVLSWLDGGSVPRLNGQLAWSPPHDAVVLAGGTELDGGVSTELLAWNGEVFSRIAEAPPVADALLLWDPIVHALRLIERGTPNTWLFVDGGFVAQPPAPASVEWWAPWPARQGDTWLNPGKKVDGSYGLVVRDGGVRPADYVMPQARSGMQALALADRGDVLIGGGTTGLSPSAGHAFYEADFGWHFAADLPALGLGAYVRAADGGVLALGGITLDAGATVANSEVWRLDFGSQRFVPLGVTLPRPAAPAAAWALSDGSLFTHGPTPLQAPLNPSRFVVDDGALAEVDAGTTPRYRSTCAVSLDDGTALAIGGERFAPFSGCTSGACATNETLRLGDGGWVIDTTYRLPTARAGHACSYDSVRRSVLVSQGIGQNGSLLERALDGGSGWRTVSEYAPDGVPELRERAVMVFDRATSTHLMIGGRDPTTQDNFNELWRLEVATARPAITWRLSLDSLLVPLRCTELRLRIRARAGATGQQRDHVTPVDGVELLLWRDGVWEPLRTGDGGATAPSDLEVELTRLDTSAFERHSVSVGVRALGARGAGEATTAVDSFEWELEYELPP